MLKGERLDRPTYSFLHTIGEEGNTAVCYRGFHDIYQREVVQKTVSTLGMPDAIAREPQLLQQVQHERIVPVWEAQWDPEHADVQAITFVTPYIEGGSIYTAFTEGDRFGAAQVRQIADDVLMALDFLHTQHGLLHRDVKPGNILLEGGRGRALLADLGSAALLDATAAADAHAGSPLYRSPEANPSGKIGVRADLYSLGVTMVEMLNGPFDYDAIDRDEVDRRLDAGRRGLPDRLYQPAPWVPATLATFVRSLCQRDPLLRPRNAAEAIRSLRGLRFVDWRLADGDGLAGRWVGHWPPDARKERQRIYEVSTEWITRGPNRGKLNAQARWRKPNGRWRGYASLSGPVDPTAEALRSFFKEVDRAAQAAPTS